MESGIVKVREALKQQKITCSGLISEKLAELKDSRNNTVNFLLEEFAMEMAHQVDEKVKRGDDIGELEGVPFGIKDVFLLKGFNASGSSAFLRNYRSPYTATAVQKLIDAGAIPIVKENCDSFGHGSTNENSYFGPARNAIDEKLVAGGSSGGSAVNVARGYTVFSVGEDTGGSIRQPAGFNKVYGLKPTYGRISRYGVMAYASSTDCVGPIAGSLEDIRILLNVMSGNDPKDRTTYDSEIIRDSVFSDLLTGSGFRVGYYKNFLNSDSIDSKILNDFTNIIHLLKESDVAVDELEFFDSNILVSTYYVLAMAETASNLARLDGTVYGERLAGKNIRDEYAITRSENFTEETRRRIISGNQVLSHGYAEGIYQKARTIRNQIVNHFRNDFQRVDIIISPVTPGKPPSIGSSLGNPLMMYLSDAYTVGFSLGGLPTLTVPFGTDTGIQITAGKNGEESVLRFANYLKRVFDGSR